MLQTSDSRFDGITSQGMTQTYVPRPYKCGSAHRFFVAETAASEGRVHIFALCTDCGEAIQRSFSVASPDAEILLKIK